VYRNRQFSGRFPTIEAVSMLAVLQKTAPTSSASLGQISSTVGPNPVDCGRQVSRSCAAGDEGDLRSHSTAYCRRSWPAARFRESIGCSSSPSCRPHSVAIRRGSDSSKTADVDEAIHGPIRASSTCSAWGSVAGSLRECGDFGGRQDERQHHERGCRLHCQT
jgi:hypothetical protein